MDERLLLDMLSTDSPVGLGGCRCDGTAFASCEYDVTVFDGGSGGGGGGGEVVRHDGGDLVRIRHGSLGAGGAGAGAGAGGASDTLIHYDQMRVIQDDSWDLRMLLAMVGERRSRIFRDYARNCLLGCMFNCTRAVDGLGSDSLARCWAKSSAVYLAYSILALNGHRPTASHCLERLRGLGKGCAAADMMPLVHECVGMERATPSLLGRMRESTIGFCEASGWGDRHSHAADAIRAKCDHFTDGSMLTDCYMYLVCTNHAVLTSQRESVHRRPELAHLLRVALDLDGDDERMRRDAASMRRACEATLSSVPAAAAG